MKSLYAEGAISLQTLDATQTAYDVAHANFVAARSVVELTTPIAGVVTAVNVNLGDLAAPGVALATVANIDRMKAIFSLNESDVAALAIGQSLNITSEARPDLNVRDSAPPGLLPGTGHHGAKCSHPDRRCLQQGVCCEGRTCIPADSSGRSD
jgi:multidrug resistance efflux pump